MGVHGREPRGSSSDTTTGAAHEPVPGRGALTETRGEESAVTPSLSLGGGRRDRRAGGSQPPMPASTLDQFTERFNAEFRAQLHAFIDSGAESVNVAESGPQAATADTADITAASGAGITPERASQLFTPRQIELLDGFMASYVIPDRLFDGDEVGTTTAQQRILLAGHILTVGNYAPGVFDQRVHARMCGHWVNLVYNYAGAATSRGAGVREQFDHTGALTLGVSEDAAGGADGLSRPGLDRGLGLGDRFSRALPREHFDQIQSGDWLYVQNFNGESTPNHSVIFSRWATDWVEAPVPHRRAITMSQGSPEGGGHEEVRSLGLAFSAGPPQITPITHVGRVDATARPMTTVEDLVAILGSGEEGRANGQFIDRLERGGRHFDVAMFQAYLREHNDALITELASHRTTTGASVMTDNQQAVFRDTNAQATELPVLIRLYQRLGVLVDNATALESEREERGAAIDARHDAGVEEAAPQREALEAQLAALDAETRELHGQSETIEPQVLLYREHTAELAAAVRERAALRRERTELRQQRAALPRPERAAFDQAHGARLAEIEARLAVLQPLIATLAPDETATRTDRRAATRSLARIDRRLDVIELNRARLRRRLDALEGTSGFHTAHGGVGRTDFNGDRDERTAVTGRMRDLTPQPVWEQFVRDEATPAVEPTIVMTAQ